MKLEVQAAIISPNFAKQHGGTYNLERNELLMLLQDLTSNLRQSFIQSLECFLCAIQFLVVTPINDHVILRLRRDLESNRERTFIKIDSDEAI